MKKIILAFATMVPMLLASCSTQRLTYMAVGAEAVQCVANFDVKEDVGSLSMEIMFPCRYWDKTTTGTVTPVIVTDGVETAFPPLSLKGEDVVGSLQTIPYSTGGNAKYAEQSKKLSAKPGKDVSLVLKYQFSRQGKTFEAESPTPYTLSKE